MRRRAFFARLCSVVLAALTIPSAKRFASEFAQGFDTPHEFELSQEQIGRALRMLKAADRERDQRMFAGMMPKGLR